MKNNHFLFLYNHVQMYIGQYADTEVQVECNLDSFKSQEIILSYPSMGISRFLAVQALKVR